MMFRLLLVCLFAIVIYAQIPCDDQYAEFCPDKAGSDVGVCLKEHLSTLSADCEAYITLHETCSEDIGLVIILY